MIAIKPNDTCYSTNFKSWGGSPNPFNTDGVERTTLDIDLARSALDFEILKKPNYDAEGRKIPKQNHLVRSDDNSIIESISVGDQFVPIQHRDIFDHIVKDIMPSIPEMKLEMCGTIHGGGTGLITATYGDTYSIRGDKSGQDLRLFFTNPSNGTGRMVLGFTTVRIICQNTLIAATKQAKADGWKISHTQNAEMQTKRAVEEIRNNAVAALEMKRMCEDLASVGVSSAKFKECLDAVFPLYGIPEDSHGYTRLVNLRNEVTEQFESGETAQTMTEKTMWTAFNSFTFPIFNPSRVSAKKDKAQIAYQGMTGSVGEKVQNIFHKVYAVASR